MINIITKDYFYKNIPEGTEYLTIHKPLTFTPNDSNLNKERFEEIITWESEVVYARFNDYFLAYFIEFNYILIPKIYNIDQVREELSVEWEITFTNWTLEKAADHRKYSINSAISPYGSVRVIDYNGEQEISDCTGNWNLTDNISGETINLDLYYSDWFGYSSGKNTTSHLISYEKRTRIKKNISELHKTDKYLELIINGCKNNQGISIKSKSDS